MAYSGKVVTQVLFRLGLRNYLNRTRCPRSLSTFAKVDNHHRPSIKQSLLSQPRILRNFVHSSQVRAMGSLSPMDPSSYSRPELAIIKHVSLSLNVDFENKVLDCSALLNIDVLKDIGELVLDVRDQTIYSVETVDGTPLSYTVNDEAPNFGSKLTITLSKLAASGEKKVVADDKSDDSSQVSGVPIPKISLTFNGFTYQPIKIDAETETIDSKESQSSSSYSMCDKVTMTCNSRNVIVFDKCTDIQDITNQGSRLKIRIKYKTSPSASALQWLGPNQTSGKKHPYLFSQCQPIHARSILPCQDTPAVKFTYDAEVTAPAQFTVLMSALRGENNNSKTTFKQPVPIPSYLLAIAVGVLESRSLGPRSLVWAEKEEIERSAWEFADTEKYLQAAEKLCGRYEWTQYDLLVLPPSFPYGGMENPCLTFVTPTLLAGDRSQADVIVHEIMHSWTGNLVTNNNFQHFWLNEGFTVFLERKVGASLISDPEEAKKSRDFHSLLGLQELSETVKDQLGISSPLTRLVPDLRGVHPDDSFSRVPYEKGSLFLRYLEDLVGGPEVFDDFLRSYLEKYQKQSLNTDQFKAYLLNYFKDSKKLDEVDWDAWLYKSGMPPIIPNYDTSMTKAITALLTKIEQPNSTLSHTDVEKFTPHQIINLLQELIDRPALSVEKLSVLGNQYKVEGTKNSEIQYRWLRLNIRSRNQDKLQEVFDFVNHQGRMKYVRPVYRDLYAWEDVRKQAIDNFLKNEPYMMHVSAYTLRKDLHLSD